MTIIALKHAIVNKIFRRRKIALDKHLFGVYNNAIEIAEGVTSMTQDKFTTLMRSGNDLVEIIRSVPKDKLFLLSMAVDAFLSGFTAGEKLAAEQDST